MLRWKLKSDRAGLTDGSRLLVLSALRAVRFVGLEGVRGRRDFDGLSAGLVGLGRRRGRGGGALFPGLEGWEERVLVDQMMGQGG